MTHLTIDIDFFINRYDRVYDIETAAVFLNGVRNTYNSLPYIIVKEHHEVLPFIENQQPNVIINVDYHSDIVTEPHDNLNEGTWANFYSNRKQSTFIWRYPNVYCNDPFTGLCDDWKPKKMGYSEVRKSKFRLNVPKKITSWSICLSPDWVEKSDLTKLRKFTPWLKLRN